MTNVQWLQSWYASQCDGDWEHAGGIEITTIDNPGWSVKIDLRGTKYDIASFDEIKQDGELDWVLCRIREGVYEGFGGAENLDQLLAIFRSWIESVPDPKREASIFPGQLH